METIAVIAVYLVAAVCIFGRPAYVKMRERMSPKYAIARQVRLAQKSAQKEAERKQARTNAKTRLDTWAAENSDDKTAQAYLATLSADTQPSETANAEEGIREMLRRRQQSDDEVQERLRQRHLQEAKYLEWALENPMDPVARRHLGTALVEVSRNAQFGPNKDQARRTVVAIEAALGVTGVSHSWE